MYFDDDLVDEVEVFQGEGLEGGVLSSFGVYLEGDVLVGEVVAAEDVFVREEGMRLSLLRLGANAHICEIVKTVVFLTDWSISIRAIVLIVWHGMGCSHITSETVLPVDSDVHQGV